MGFIFSFAWRWLRSLFRVIWLLIALNHRPDHFSRKPKLPEQSQITRRRPKPEWVKQEVIRLKAHMIHSGCRCIANTFNRLHAIKDRMSVGKTYVYKVILNHQYDIHALRRKIKHKKPKSLPKNLLWSLDLTQVSDEHKQLHTLFGIIDAGTRKCLSLENIGNKASITLLRVLCDAIEHFGKPKNIRTDNEAVFVSRLFRFGLWLLNIRHQRTDVCCPWQNGRIERFFGTLKSALKQHVIQSAAQLKNDLILFRLWYNHIRPHQNLDGRTPAEAWNTTEPGHKGKHCYFSAWGDALTGFYIPPG